MPKIADVTSRIRLDKQKHASMRKAQEAQRKIAEKVNSKDMQAELQTVIEHIFHRKMFIYGVSRNKSVDLQSLYMNLLQIGRLPKAKDITLDFIGE